MCGRQVPWSGVHPEVRPGLGSPVLVWCPADMVAAGVLFTVGYWLLIPFLLCGAGMAPRASHMLGEYSSTRHICRLVRSFLDIDRARLERSL